MAIRDMIRIDEDKCDGCGLCVPACAEGAIQIIDGKARLVSDHLCDGLGACLGHCPQGAIIIEQREAVAFDEHAVHAQSAAVRVPATNGCPSAQLKVFVPAAAGQPQPADSPVSELRQWPVLLNLVPPTAPFLRGKELLLCADCVPFACAQFHSQLLKGRSVVVGCPKFDDTAHYVEKLAALFQAGGITKIVIARMEVPCCSGLIAVTKRALEQSGVEIPLETIQISLQGEIMGR